MVPSSLASKVMQQLGTFPRFGEAGVETFKLQGVAGFHFAVEFADGILVEHVFDEPLVFHREVVAAPRADAREFAVQIRGPQVEAAMRAGIRAGDGAVFLGAGADVRPLPLRDSLSSSQSESVVRLRTVSGSMEGR